MGLTLSSPLSALRGVGEKKAQLLSKLGPSTVGELLCLYPRDYADRRITRVEDTSDGKSYTLLLTVRTPPLLRRGRKVSVCSFLASDESGSIAVTAFNQPWLTSSLKVGEKYRASGRVSIERFARKLEGPVFEKYSPELPELLPVYPLTKGIAQSDVRRAVSAAMECCDQITEFLPRELIERYSLMGLTEAVENVHRPFDTKTLEAARRRLAFDELLVYQLGARTVREGSRSLGAPAFTLRNSGAAGFFRSLPFKLTGAQERCVKELFSDLGRDVPMSRLLQGDVGSGKTAVAAACAYLCVKNGYQCAVMAPTEILASQHRKTFETLLSPYGINTALITGSGSAAARREERQAVADGSAQVAVGTHALLGEGVSFDKLGLVITDEQHRFGVMQRARLTEKGKSPHVLVMSATPIPRTLALILYGDLDISVIDELPPGREPVETLLVGEKYRRRLWNFVRKTVEQGNQVYIICPLVEDSETCDLKSVQSHGRRLRDEVFPDLKVGLLHGRMKQSDKDAVMGGFAEGSIQVLVSTTVIEVGVDVPNATLMIVENADRYGLSQLHQLRGRVGRGKAKSYCVLISDADSEISKQRLQVMCETSDGFKIAETDLRLRGPGDFIGQRQHGEFGFAVADLAADMGLLETTKEAASEIIGKGLFTSPEYKPLADMVTGKFGVSGHEQILN